MPFDLRSLSTFSVTQYEREVSVSTGESVNNISATYVYARVEEDNIHHTSLDNVGRREKGRVAELKVKLPYLEIYGRKSRF